VACFLLIQLRVCGLAIKRCFVISEFFFVALLDTLCDNLYFKTPPRGISRLSVVSENGTLDDSVSSMLLDDDDTDLI